MGLRRVVVLAAAVAVSCLVVPVADAAAGARPPVVWLRGEGNFTPAHRSVQSIDRIVVHVTEGSFWGSVRWLKNPRAHASSHFVVSRNGKIIQLVHISDIAWHAGHWTTNEQSVGIEHEGFTYGSLGFTDAQYHASARLAAWIARRSLMPIDRKHLIGHYQVSDGRGGRGGSSHHTDPGPHWKWNYYLRLVRRYAGVIRLSVKPLLPEGPLRGIVSFRAKASPDIGRVEFIVDGRVVHVDHRRPFAYALNTAKLANRGYKLQVHGIAGPGRYDVEGTRVVVDNKTFALTSAGARPWMRAPTKIRLRVRPWGAKAAKMVFTVDGRTRTVDRRPPFLFAWGTTRAKPGRHVLRGRRHVGRRPHRRATDPRRRLPPEAEARAETTSPRRSRRRSRSSASRWPTARRSPASSSGASTFAAVRRTSSSSSTASCAAATSRRPTRSAGTPPPSRRGRTA